MEDKLSPREESILLGLLMHFIQTREPVSSKTLAEQSPERISSATVRSILARLEEKGFLQQPHPNAGRIPTDHSYRYLTRRILSDTGGDPPLNLAEVERLVSDGSLNAVAKDVSGVLARSVRALGFAVTPPVESMRMRHCELIAIGENRVLCLVVSQAGQMHEKVLWAGEAYSPEQLRWFSGYLNERYAGCTFPEIRRKLRAQLEIERSRYNHRVLNALELVSLYFRDAPRDRELFWDGATWLLESASLEDNMEGVRRLLESLEKKSRLLELLDTLVESGGSLKVVLGSDWPDPRVRDLAMVAAPFGNADIGFGVLGIIGPKSLRYDAAISSVRKTARLATLAGSRL